MASFHFFVLLYGLKRGRDANWHARTHTYTHTSNIQPASPDKLGHLRCFSTFFRRPYRYFSIALKGILSLSDRYKIFASDWLWIEVYQKAVLTKIDIAMTTINKKKMEIDKSRILRNRDLLLKIQIRFQCNRIFRKKIEPHVFFFFFWNVLVMEVCIVRIN